MFTADQAVTVTVVCSSSATPTPPPSPSLTGEGICTESNELVYTLTNNGGSPTGTINYVVFTPSGESITGSTGPLNPGESSTISLGNRPPGTYTLFTEDGSVTVAVTCNETVLPSPTPYICEPETFTDGGGNPEDFPSINTNTAEYCVDTQLPKDWTPVEVGAATCPDWLVYHTNITGDWEIFRLGELPDEPDANANLTQGVGERINDVSPARSPDSEWIAFTSNRPGNWELFIGRTNGSEQRRVTFNNFAIDTSPAWSPLGDTIAFQSNRNGNWDIFLVDLATGVETQLTSNTANDIYPSWSPDGTKIAFQSDRDGFWQIYEIVVATGVETRLSDGTADDHDPLYSTDGTKIAFRSFRDGDNSVIYVMDADGQNLLQISDPAGDARNAVWSEDDQLIAYNSTLDGDQDIYVYQFAVGDQPAQTRHLTDNTTVDVSPTWLCSAPTIVWTSDATEDPNVGADNNIFSTNALPIDAPAIDVKAEASQLTEDPANDRDPQNTPPIELASRASMQIGEERNR
ncbi:MAG: WD40 domain-containing protein [Chloroflexi bacterium OLB15]|nr:MAG: WD40 domain-containing protein [Chloroflexi bacterium OLB15]